MQKKVYALQWEEFPISYQVWVVINNVMALMGNKSSLFLQNIPSHLIIGKCFFNQ